MASTDFITSSGALQIKDGDFVTGESDEQHIEDILRANKGDYKHEPLVGVDILNYVNAPNDAQVKTALKRAIKLQLEHDGYRAEDIQVESLEAIKVKAERA